MHPGVVSGGQQESERLGVSGVSGVQVGAAGRETVEEERLGQAAGTEAGSQAPGARSTHCPTEGLMSGCVFRGLGRRGMTDRTRVSVGWLWSPERMVNLKQQVHLKLFAKDVFSVFSVFIHGLSERVVLEYELVVNDRGQPDSQCQSWGKKQRG